MVEPAHLSAAFDPYLRMRVVGVGGVGCLAVECILQQRLGGVGCIVADTDPRALASSSAPIRVHLAPQTGPSVAAVWETLDDLERALRRADLVFVLGIPGSDAGSEAAPMVAHMAREGGALTVGVVIEPSNRELQARPSLASGLQQLLCEADTVIAIPAAQLLSSAGIANSPQRAMQAVVHCIVELLLEPGLVDIDFNDIRSVLVHGGRARFGRGQARGIGSAVRAARAVLTGPLQGAPLRGARSILLSVRGGERLSLQDVSDAAAVICSAASRSATIAFGVTVDPRLRDDEYQVLVIATGLTI